MNGHMNGHTHAPAQAQVATLSFSGDVRRLSLGPTDMLVLKIDAQLDSDTVGRLQAYLAAACGIEPRRVIVIGLGMDLSVLEGKAE